MTGQRFFPLYGIAETAADLVLTSLRPGLTRLRPGALLRIGCKPGDRLR